VTSPRGPHCTLAAVAIRVVLAEDNLLIREGVSHLLDAENDVHVVSTCGDLDALLAAVETERPDVVLTDIRMPPTGTDEGIRAASRLRGTHPHLGVVVLSQYDDPGYAVSLLEAGSAGRAYLLKERVSEPEQLVAAIREVARGGSVIDPKIVETLVSARARAVDSPLAELTPREREVLAQMAQGKNNAAIGHTLTLTTRAVERHINAVFAKLPLAEQPEVDRRVKAVLLFLSD
jgi:DNA-binding NarL/FixJ family response regulator